MWEYLPVNLLCPPPVLFWLGVPNPEWDPHRAFVCAFNPLLCAGTTRCPKRLSQGPMFGPSSRRAAPTGGRSISFVGLCVIGQPRWC